VVRGRPPAALEATLGRLSERVRWRLRTLARRGTLAVLSRPAVETVLRRRARAAWATREPVVFVCYGNICRSPFAEGLLRGRPGAGRAASSAGTLPRAGRPSPPDAIAVARKWSVDLGGHRSRVLDAALVSGAGAVFVFDVDNLFGVLRRFPGSVGRTHLLGALDPDGLTVVDDPYGRPRAEFARVYEQIAALLETADRGRED
jgi:protein-tyrosine phosphatase